MEKEDEPLEAQILDPPLAPTFYFPLPSYQKLKELHDLSISTVSITCDTRITNAQMWIREITWECVEGVGLPSGL